MLFALFVAWISVRLLRFGDPFRRFFPDTCIYMDDDEVVLTLVVFLIALSTATACFVSLYRRNAWLRRFAFRFLVAMIAFGFGVFITT